MRIAVRPVRAEDAQAVHDIQVRPEVLPYILPLPSLRREQVERRLSALGEDMHFFVAEMEGETVGYAGLRQLRGRDRHVGELFLAVHPDRHGQGAGTALLRAIIDLADNRLMLERLQLSALATDPRALSLYERLGFAVEGRRRGGVSAGRYVDEILMARLHPGGAIVRRAGAEAKGAERADGMVD